jgi:hypothetical protein
VPATFLNLPFIESPDSDVLSQNVAFLRRADQITSIVLHQNGFRWKPTNRNRWKIRAHFQVWNVGTATQIAPIEARLRSSSNGANAHCIALEFDGNFEGHPGKRDFFKPEKFGAHTLSTPQIQCGRAIIATCVRLFPSIRYVYAHRQWGISAKTGRPNKPLCPGHEIWTHLGEWAKDAFGLDDGGPDWCQKGTPIPASWRGAPIPL